MRALLTYQVVLSLFVALSLTLSSTIDFSGSITDPFPANFAGAMDVRRLFLFLASFAACLCVLYVFQRLIEKAIVKLGSFAVHRETPSHIRQMTLSEFMRNNIAAFVCVTFLVLLAWGLVWANYYPGTSMNDQIWIIDAPVANANNHPLLHNLALAGCVRIGTRLFGDANLGFALYIVVQMLICSLIVAFCTLWLLYRRTPKIVAGAFVVFFAFYPVFSNYAISAIKDTMFSFFLLLWVPFLYEAVHNKEDFWKKPLNCVYLIILILMISLIRNNGIYISLAMAVVLVIVFRKQAALRLVFCTLLAVALSSLPNLLLSLTGHEQLFRESVGIPLQQICAVVCEEGDTLTDEQRDYIDQIIPIETIKSSYAPMSVDAIKYNPAFDTDFLQRTKGDFLKTYIELGMSHPGLYWRALLSQTWGYWSITAWDSTQSVFFGLCDNYKEPALEEIMNRWGLQNESLYPHVVAEAFDGWYRQAALAFPGPGMCFFLLLLSGFLLTVVEQSTKRVLLITPFVFLWLTLLISAPLSCSLRYALPMLMALPLLLGLFASDLSIIVAVTGLPDRDKGLR